MDYIFVIYPSHSPGESTLSIVNRAAMDMDVQLYVSYEVVFWVYV